MHQKESDFILKRIILWPNATFCYNFEQMRLFETYQRGRGLSQVATEPPLGLRNVTRSAPEVAISRTIKPKVVFTWNGASQGGGDSSEAWDRETMFSQLAKRSSQNVDSGVRHNKYFRSTINFNMRNSLQNLCVFCRGKVSGERLISHGTYCQFRTREYSMEATSMKTFLF